MKRGIIYLYAGKIEEWTKDWKEEKNREERAYAAGSFSFGDFRNWDMTSCFPKIRIRNNCWKPWLPHWKKALMASLTWQSIRRSILTSAIPGGWAVCALASMPCGVDIQERRPIRSRRMVERTMNAREQRQILEAEDGTGEFIKLWTYKESCIKLSGGGPSPGYENPETAWLPSVLLAGEKSGRLCGRGRTFYLGDPAGISKNPFSLKQMSAICCHKKRLSSYIYLKKR